MSDVLSTRARQGLLSLHLLLTAASVGGLMALLLLQAAKSGIRASDLAAVDRQLFYLYEYLVMNATYGFAYTGLAFSLLTRWGLARFWWVIVKWLGLLILTVVMLIWVSPAVNGMAARSDVLLATALIDPIYQQASHDVTVWVGLQLALQLLVVMVSVFKPWGQRSSDLPPRVVWLAGATLAVGLATFVVFQNTTLLHYRRLPVRDIALNTIPDGQYRGESSATGSPYAVRVTVHQHRIIGIDILETRRDRYGALAAGITSKVLRAQQLEVDAVTGATTTSKALLLAIEDALYQATQR